MSPPDQSDAGADVITARPGLESSDGSAMPARGELGIKEKRTWKTWQLVTGMLVALLLGMAVDYYLAGGQGSATSSSGAPAYHIPTSNGSTTTTSSTAGGSSGSTTTAAAGGSTTTTQAGGSTTTSTSPSTSPTAAAGPARVLMGPMQLQGNWTSPAFTTTAAGWNIGWAFRCVPAPASGPSLQVFVTPAGSSPSGTPVISETGPSGQSVTTQSTLGTQTLVVQAPATCTWVVKVTGS
jgi:hypothetical protein